MASMRNWIQGDEPDDTPDRKTDSSRKRRVAVVHCKAGKGRSGTAACSYLISEEGWQREDALRRFTERRMRVGFGNGVSIPSQLRWVGYVDRWTNQMNKKYVERPVEIIEIHVWGLRDGVKIAVEGYVENGRRIQNFHVFKKDEKIVMDNGKSPEESELSSPSSASSSTKNATALTSSPLSSTDPQSTYSLPTSPKSTPSDGATVLLKPSTPIILPTSDINIDFERRNKASYTGWTMVTSVAHVWFNAYFEGGHAGKDSGVFEIDWEAMDGIKGSARKGTKALDRLKVVWRYPSKEKVPSMQPVEKVITQPARGEPVPEPEPADWRGDQDKVAAAEASHSGGVDSGRPGGAMLTMGATIAAGAQSFGKDLGLRKEDPGSKDISRANSMRSGVHPSPAVGKGDELEREETRTEEEDREGVRTHGPDGEDVIPYENNHHEGKEGKMEGKEKEGRSDTWIGRAVESGVEKLGNALPGRTKTTNSNNKHRKEDTT
jgi:protein-tyrosine phosphatase